MQENLGSECVAGVKSRCSEMGHRFPNQCLNCSAKYPPPKCELQEEDKLYVEKCTDIILTNEQRLLSPVRFVTEPQGTDWNVHNITSCRNTSYLSLVVQEHQTNLSWEAFCKTAPSALRSVNKCNRWQERRVIPCCVCLHLYTLCANLDIYTVCISTPDTGS